MRLNEGQVATVAVVPHEDEEEIVDGVDGAEEVASEETAE
jgi:hypothetical protein